MRIFASLFCFLSFTCSAADLVSVSLSEIRLVDLLRVVYSDLSPSPFVLSPAVLLNEDKFTVDLRGVKVSAVVSAVSDLADSVGFEIVRRSGVVWIGKRAELPDEIIIYHPRFRSARYLADVVQSVTGARSLMARSIRSPDVAAPHAAIAAASVVPPIPQANLLSPSSVEGQIDRSEVDQISFTVSPKEAAKVRKLLVDLDTASGEVVLKAAVYEVGVDKREGSAVNVVASVLGGRFGVAAAGGVFDGVSIKIGVGGIDAVLSALDADSRFKSVSRPQVRVKNGAQARFSVGQDVPVLGSLQADKNGNPLQSVDYRQSGVILTVTPEIRADVVELLLNQELSNFVLTKTGVNNSPTLIKRSVNTKLGLVPGEVVMLAGLQDDQEDEASSRVPFMGWLFGHQLAVKRSEILVFVEVVKL
jgi:type II secretory pathway component GspD/PulD (secretin)